MHGKSWGGAACAGCPAFLPRPLAASLLFGECPRTGFSLVGFPIAAGANCLGGWVLGQVRLTSPAGKTLKNIAKTSGLRLADAKSGLEAIPRVGWEYLGQIVEFLDSVNKMLPRMIQDSRAGRVDPHRLQKLTAMLPEKKPPGQNK